MAIEKKIISEGSKQIGKKEYSWEVTQVIVPSTVATDADLKFNTIKIFKTYEYQGKISRDYALPLGEFGCNVVKEIMELAHADIENPTIPAPVSEDGDDIAW